MPYPVSGPIRIHESVLNNEEGGPRRLCLQRLNPEEGEGWEVRLMHLDDQSLTWEEENWGITGLINRITSTVWGLFSVGQPDRIVLGMRNFPENGGTLFQEFKIYRLIVALDRQYPFLTQEGYRLLNNSFRITPINLSGLSQTSNEINLILFEETPPLREGFFKTAVLGGVQAPPKEIHSSPLRARLTNCTIPVIVAQDRPYSYLTSDAMNRIFTFLPDLNDESLLKVNLDQLSNEPLQILKQIHDMKITTMRIQLVDSDGNHLFGTDGGGLGRMFLGTLFAALVNGSKEGQKGALSFRQAATGALPEIASEKETFDETIALESMGMLLARCLVKANDLIGPVFDEKLYHCLSLYLKNPSESRSGDELTKEFYLALNTDDLHIQKMGRYCDEQVDALSENELSQALFWSYPERDWPETEFGDGSDVSLIREHYGLIQDEISESIFNLAKKDRAVRAIICLSSGFMKGLGNTGIDNFRGLDQNGIQEKIQGKLSKAFLKNQLNANDDTLKNDLKRWIDQASEVEIIRFVEAATGAKSLGEQKINCQQYPGMSEGRLPSFNTCSYQIHFPRYSSYQKFKERFDMALKEALSGTGFQLE